MSRFLLIVVILTVFIQPVIAQDGSDLAARVPDSVSLYAELRVDENLEADLQDLAALTAPWTGVSPEAGMSFNTMLRQILPGATFEDDILPWIGGRVGMVVFGDFMQSEPDYAAFAPVTDAEAAEAFIARLSSYFPDSDTDGDVTVYRNNTYQLVSAPDFVAFGTPAGVDRLMNFDEGASLADDAAFVETRAALPADSLTFVYISGRWISRA